MRLNHRDMSLYGTEPDNDVFSVVTCHYCGMTVKTQVYADHVKHRHNFGPMSDIALALVDLQGNEIETTLHESSIKQASKRRRTETDNDNMSHSKQIKIQNTNHSLVSHIPEEDYLQSQNSFKQEPTSEVSSSMIRAPKAKFYEETQENVRSPSGFIRPRPVTQSRRHSTAQKKSSSFVSPYQTQFQQTFIAPQQVRTAHSFPSQQLKTENPTCIKMILKKSDLGSWKIVSV